MSSIFNHILREKKDIFKLMLKLLFHRLPRFKGTVSVILSGPLCKDDNARFLVVSLKALSDQV